MGHPVSAYVGAYHELCDSKLVFMESLESELKQRDIVKQQKFHFSKLNIKLQTFKGYDSPTDIYTFQSNFEKLYLKSTPKNLLPDLIKNNHLSGPALTLVKGIDTIYKIWKRLKASYGDSKILLSKNYLSYLAQPKSGN